jgi:starvation-inducible outer membrane lipoprotein
MKKQTSKWLALAASAVVLQGCVAIPPLIQVERKDNNDEIMKRLDSIDRRLERLEEKPAGQSEKK